MKYIGMPCAVWQFFCRSFEKNLPIVFGLSPNEAKSVMSKAKRKYKEIIGKLPEFEKDDRFRMNIIGCAMLAAVILNMPERPKVEILTEYYRNSILAHTHAAGHADCGVCHRKCLDHFPVHHQ